MEEKNTYASRVEALRHLMSKNGVDAYVVPTDDFHASEYAAPYFACRRWLTGFTGSAGTAVVTQKEACLWADGRYFIQAAQQLQGSGIRLMKMGEKGVPKIKDYLAEALPEGGTLGYDGRTITMENAALWKEAVDGKNIRFLENLDLIGELWEDRPAFPAAPVWRLDPRLTGETAPERIARVRSTMAEKGADALFLTCLDDICWLYMLRGSDQADSLTCMSYALITPSRAVLYASEEAVSPELRDELSADGITLKPYFSAYEDIRSFPGGKTLWADPASVNTAFAALLKEDVLLLEAPSPTILMKSVKTPTEQENERKIHIEDGAAVTKLIIALKKAYGTKEWAEGKYTEISVAEMLLQLRKQRPGFITESFSPIIATGEHGAIIHYSATEETDVPLADNGFMMMDTGGQYEGGTTDITRTISFGTLSAYEKQCFTAVLQGHMALGSARFMQGTTGTNLDVLARTPLWNLGLDYRHGTGHGVGFMLNVHEGPQSVHLRTSSSDTAFAPGMITSDEPGVYLEGRFGIRTENLTLCVKDGETEWGTRLRFDMLTMVPYDKDAIDVSMLSDAEIDEINAYHALVLRNLRPLMEKDELPALEEMCAPLER